MHLQQNLTAFNWVLTIFVFAWLINLYNFMDGIDGIAASQAVFASCVGGGLLLGKGAPGPAFVCWSLAAACMGFLIWNWPPARIFLGGVGSEYLGYCFAVLMFESLWQHVLNLWVWPILLGAFAVDASFTLLRRIIHGDRWYEAHLTHAYQKAAKIWGHRRVDLALATGNLFWLAPLATIAAVWPRAALWLAMAAFLPLIFIVMQLGAGSNAVTFVRTASRKV